jgi:sugar phosphate isomerase/epimerase
VQIGKYFLAKNEEWRIIKLNCGSRITEHFYEMFKSKGHFQLVPATQPSKNHPLAVEVLLSAILKCSRLGIKSMSIPILNENQLAVLSEANNLNRIRQECKKHSVTIDIVNLKFLPSLIIDDTPDDQLEKLWRKIGNITQSLGAEVIETVSPSLTDDSVSLYRKLCSRKETTPIADMANLNISWKDLWFKFISSMQLHAKLASDYSLKLAVEPRPREILCNTDSLVRLFDFVDMDNLGGVVDVGRLYTAREVPSISLKKLYNKTFVVHLSDSDGITEWHWPPGQGKVDWTSILKDLRNLEYDGLLSLDVSGISLEREISEGKEYIENILRSLDWLPAPLP